jgi:hypothetical protein
VLRGLAARRRFRWLTVQENDSAGPHEDATPIILICIRPTRRLHA